MIPAQLPEEIGDEQVAQLLEDPNWGVSQKLDGHRMIVDFADKQAWPYGRNGIMKHPKPKILENMLVADNWFGWTLDGELMEDGFYAFDLIRGNDQFATNLPARDRIALLERLVNKVRSSVIKFVPFHTDPVQKRALFQRARDESAEGVVFKNLKAPYKSGRNRNFLKFKFTKDVDCVVTAAYIDGKKNFGLSVYGPDGEEISVGNVSALTGDSDRISIGDVVTVQCLYVSDNNRLVQPVSPRKRTDKTPNECLVDQLNPLKTRKDILI